MQGRGWEGDPLEQLWAWGTSEVKRGLSKQHIPSPASSCRNFLSPILTEAEKGELRPGISLGSSWTAISLGLGPG